MNIKTKTCLLIFFLMLVGSSGCVSGRNDLGRSGEIKVVTVGSKHTELLTPSVYEEKGELVVSGQVRRSPMTSGVISGHIHIEWLSSEGSVLKDATTSLGTTLRRGRTRVASYMARLPWTLTPSSTIRVSLSGDEHPAE